MLRIIIACSMFAFTMAWTSETVSHGQNILAIDTRLRIQRVDNKCVVFHDNTATTLHIIPECHTAEIEYPWIFVGAPTTNKVYIFRYEDKVIDLKQTLDTTSNADSIDLNGRKPVPDSHLQRFGWSLSASGSWLFVGAPGKESHNQGNYTLREQGNISASPKCSPETMPDIDALAGDAYPQGAVATFKLVNDRWTASQRLQRKCIYWAKSKAQEYGKTHGPCPTMLGAAREANRANDFFGWSVSVSGNLAVIGAPGDLYANMECYDQATGEMIQGYAYIVKLEQGTDVWDSNDEYLAGEQGDAVGILEYRGFGRSVHVDGNVVAVSSYPLYNRRQLPVVYLYDCSSNYCVEQDHIYPDDKTLNFITDTLAATQIGDPDQIAPTWQNKLWGATVRVNDFAVFVSDPSRDAVWQHMFDIQQDATKHTTVHQQLVSGTSIISTNTLQFNGCPKGFVGDNNCDTECPAIFFSHSKWSTECLRCPPATISEKGSYRENECFRPDNLGGESIPDWYYIISACVVFIFFASCIGVTVATQNRGRSQRLE